MAGEGLDLSVRQGVERIHVEDQLVDPAAAVERVDADATLDPVVARAAVHFLADEAALESDIRSGIERLAVGQHAAGRAERPAEQRVDAFAAEEPLAAEDLVTARALAAVAAKRVVAGVAEDLVDARPTKEHVVVGTAAERVVAVAPLDTVVARAAVEVVVAAVAGDLVGAAAAEDPVGFVAARKDVVAVGDPPLDGEPAKPCRHDPDHAIGGPRPGGTGEIGGESEVRRGLIHLEARQVDLPVGHEDEGISAPDHVEAFATRNGVVAGAADQNVVARIAGDNVHAAAGFNNIVSFIGSNLIVTCIREHGIVAGAGVDPVVAPARARDRIGDDPVVAPVGVDRVAAVAGVDRVDSLVTVDGVAIGLRLGVGDRRRHSLKVAENRVAIQRAAGWVGGRAAAAGCRAGDDPVAARAADDVIAAEARVDKVVAGVEPNRVVAGKRIDRVVA